MMMATAKPHLLVSMPLMRFMPKSEAISVGNIMTMLTEVSIRYLGEWHTHPEDNPNPSGLDRSEWNHLSAKRRDKRPTLAVIVGRNALYIELVPSSGQKSIFSPVE